jgi:hypothetical protein
MSKLRDLIREERRRRIVDDDKPIVIFDGLTTTTSVLDQLLREIDGTTRGLPSEIDPTSSENIH